jgi:hypothetical protein
MCVMRVMRVACVVWVALVGCYNPSPRACRTVCETSADCSGGLTCGATGYCQGAIECTTASSEIDATQTQSDARYCLGEGFLEVCFDQAPTNDEVITNAMIDTTVDCSFVVPQPNGPEVCVKLARSWDIRANYRALGARPLALVALDGIRISGSLDASSQLNVIGPGAMTQTGCHPPLVGGSSASTSPGGGGGGGALTGIGGPGGGAGATAGGNGGLPILMIDKLRAGCAGANGGSYMNEGGGVGGLGGGGVYLISGTSIIVTGRINASGSGGNAPLIKKGGSGGGSGGFIGLDAKSYTIDVNARIFAVGGGGSSGGTTTGIGQAGGVSAAGSDGAGGTTADVATGVGGTGKPVHGMNGGAGTTGGGGGGGGSGGFIGAVGMLVAPSGTIVPPHQAM